LSTDACISDRQDISYRPDASRDWGQPFAPARPPSGSKAAIGQTEAFPVRGRSLSVADSIMIPSTRREPLGRSRMRSDRRTPATPPSKNGKHASWGSPWANCGPLGDTSTVAKHRRLD
jgi:hypothetical protein